MDLPMSEIGAGDVILKLCRTFRHEKTSRSATRSSREGAEVTHSVFRKKNIAFSLRMKMEREREMEMDMVIFGALEANWGVILEPRRPVESSDLHH